MKKFLVSLVSLFSIVALQAASIDTLAIHSAKMDRAIETLVIVPDDVSQPTPTLYLLHGYSGKYTSWMSIRDLRPLADQYGIMIVCPNGENSWYWDSPKRADSQFETFVSSELVEYIDKNYKTVAHRTGRAISGLSMGGHGAMWTALRHKDKFGAVASMSGGLDIRPFPEKWQMAKQLGEKAQNEEVWDNHAAINAIGDLRNGELKIAFDCGVDDFFIDVNRAFHQKLVDMKVAHDYTEREGAHTSTYWRNSIIYHMHFFDQYFKDQEALRKQRAEWNKTGIATIESDQIKLQVSKKGAEMMSIISKESGREFLWQGDPSQWKFRSPILFPIVGGVNGGTYRLDGKEYSITNHGFARDYDWDLVQLTPSKVVFRLKAPEEKRANYPFDFVLEIAYSVVRDNISVAYKVTNPSDETIYFQLGAHPGFNYKDFDADAAVQGYYQFDDKAAGDKLSVSVSNKDGLIVKKRSRVTLSEGGVLPITKSTFNNDALILENSQTQSIALLDRNKNPYVRVTFDAPVVGMWSKGGNLYAPFACIEPWYGRCDDAGYKGDYKDKPWVQSLEAKGVFSTKLSIWIGK